MHNVDDERYDELYANVRAQLAEHFQNFMFVVMDEEGEVYMDYTNIPVAKMLAREVLDPEYDFTEHEEPDEEAYWDE